MNNVDNKACSISIVKKKLFKNPILVGGLIGFFFFSLFSCLLYFKTFDKFELATIDWRFNHFHNDSKPSDNCLVLGINTETSRALEKNWPYPRSIYGELLEALDFYGAKSVSFDLFFPSDDEKNPGSDIQFVKAVKHFQDNGGYVILGTTVDPVKDNDYYSKQDLIKLKQLSLKPQNELNVIDLSELFFRVKKDILAENKINLVIQKPFQSLFNAINTIGMVNLYSRDLEVISTPLIIKYNSLYFSNVGLQTYLTTLKSFSIKQKGNYLFINNSKIPIYNDNLFFINWYKPLPKQEFPYKMKSISWVIDSYRFISKTSKQMGISKIAFQNKIEELVICKQNNNCTEKQIYFENLFPRDLKIQMKKTYQGKHIFVGLVDQVGGTKDIITTPIIEKMPGVFIHINIFDNLQQEHFIKSLSFTFTILIMFILTLLTGISILNVSDPKTSMGIGLIYVFYAIIPLLVFKYFSIYTDLFYTEMAIVLTYFTCVAYQWRNSDIHNKLLKKTFSNYLAPQIMEEVLSDPSKVELGGDTKEITILFSDIRNFTSISEKKSSKEIVKFLNEYFDSMVDAVMVNEGTMDKFIGDAVMAFWGAPVKKENHAELAILSALDMVDNLDKLKKKWVLEDEAFPEIDIGIGINTGLATVGNVGSSKLQNYTIIGDSVNLASRLEGLNKKYAINNEKSNNIIISEYTYKQVEDLFNVEELGVEKVKGKDIPVKIYRVLGKKGVINEKI